MKIKLSKVQWEMIGKKAGWRKAQTIPSDGYTDGGEPYTDEEMDLMEKQDKEKSKRPTEFYDMEKGDRGRTPKVPGYYLIKQHQMWGWCPTYRNENDNKNDILFYYHQTNQLLTWPEMKALLKETWRPVSKEESDWFIANLGEK
jgi:hypothetical protein